MNQSLLTHMGCHGNLILVGVASGSEVRGEGGGRLLPNASGCSEVESPIPAAAQRERERESVCVCVCVWMRYA